MCLALRIEIESSISNKVLGDLYHVIMSPGWGSLLEINPMRGIGSTGEWFYNRGR